MTSFEEFRATSHELLKELDAATIKMMMLVSAKEVSGPFWADAAQRHHDAVDAWHSSLRISLRIRLFPKRKERGGRFPPLSLESGSPAFRFVL
ncbi:hypothetical protein D3C78_1323400 [compost metagenome]